MTSTPACFRSLVPILVGLVPSLVPLSLDAAQTGPEHNWPAWRGPSGNGLVTHGNPPVQWSEEKNVKWKTEIPGGGHATPVIWGDRVFVLTAVPTGKVVPRTPSAEAAAPAPDSPPRRGPGGPGRPGGPRRGGDDRPTEEHAFTVLCLDRRSGTTLWTRTPRQAVPHQAIQQSNSYSSGSPVTDGERLYAYFGPEGLHSYDFEGNPQWSKDFGKMNVTFGEGSSPALWDDVLIVVQDNNSESWIHALDKTTGRELWKQRREERSGWTTPYIFKSGDAIQVVVSGAKAVRSYDLRTGNVLWQCSGLGSNPVPMPVADAQTVYAMSGHREPAAMAIRLGKSGDLTGTDAVLWKFDRGTPYVPSPLLYEGLLFFCQRNDALVTCLNPVTGEPHYVQQRIDGIVGVYASPIGVQNRIYLPGQNGVTVVLGNSKELKVLASNKLDDGFDASPAVVGDELFLRGRQHLYCLAAD